MRDSVKRGTSSLSSPVNHHESRCNSPGVDSPGSQLGVTGKSLIERPSADPNSCSPFSALIVPAYLSESCLPISLHLAPLRSPYLTPSDRILVAQWKLEKNSPRLTRRIRSLWLLQGRWENSQPPTNKQHKQDLVFSSSFPHLNFCRLLNVVANVFQNTEVI